MQKKIYLKESFLGVIFICPIPCFKQIIRIIFKGIFIHGWYSFKGKFWSMTLIHAKMFLFFNSYVRHFNLLHIYLKKLYYKNTTSVQVIAWKIKKYNSNFRAISFILLELSKNLVNITKIENVRNDYSFYGWCHISSGKVSLEPNPKFNATVDTIKTDIIDILANEPFVYVYSCRFLSRIVQETKIRVDQLFLFC